LLDQILIKLKRGENMKHLISAMLVTLFASTSFAADITVEMLNKRKSDNQTMVYSEDISRIDVGDTITWVPTTKGHNVHFLAGPDGWDIPKKSKFNKEVSITFDTPGIYYYQCTPHKSMGMIALVVVGGDTSNKEAIAKIRAMGKSKKKLKALLEEL
jgi:pseudoazurin